MMFLRRLFPRIVSQCGPGYIPAYDLGRGLGCADKASFDNAYSKVHPSVAYI